MVESYVPAELIFPTISNGSGNNAVNFDTGEVKLSSLESLRAQVVALLDNVTRVRRLNSQLQNLVQDLTSEALVDSGDGILLLNWDKLLIGQMNSIQINKLIKFLKSFVPSAESNVNLIKHDGSRAFWSAKESGGIATRQHLVRATELACRAPDPTDIVKQHELAHLALGQNYPELINFRIWAEKRAQQAKSEKMSHASLVKKPSLMQRWLERFQPSHKPLITQVSENQESDPLSGEIRLVLSQFSAIMELNSMLVEFNLDTPAENKDFMFYYRIAETLSVLKKRLPFDLHSKLYGTIAQFFDLELGFNPHNIARIVMLFGANVLINDPTSTQFFDEKQLFGESHIRGVRPNDSELVALVATIKEKELQLLDADKNSKTVFYESMKKLSDTITPVMVQRLNYLSNKAREIMALT